jgi:hypothetical protein
VLLDALAAGDEGRARHPAAERLHQGRLPDAGLTPDEHHLALAAHAPPEPRLELGELRVPPEEPRPIRSAARSDRGHGCAGLLHRGDEAIPATMHRLDDARRARVLVEGTPELLDAARQRRLADDGVGPDPVEQLGLRDQPPRMRCQVLQDRERLRAKRDGLGPPAQPRVVDVE